MFKHQGSTRTLSHNLKIASLLSFVAGIVNITGFLAVQRLTTNVTGHFAFLVDEALKLNFMQTLIFLFYILSFFFGSFVSSLMVEIISKKNERFIYIAPVITEMIILSIIPFLGEVVTNQANAIACSLLFAMGLQNSLVTSLSNSMVRTTHLTGLFTDLGIELSQLFFYKTVEQRIKLKSSIRLRFTIIGFFFIGGVAGGLLYSFIQLWALLLGSLSLLSGLVYDSEKFRMLLKKGEARSGTASKIGYLN